MDKLYDILADPEENHNMIFHVSFAEQMKDYRARLHAILVKEEATQVPFTHKTNMSSNLRRPAGSEEGVFPDELMRDKNW